MKRLIVCLLTVVCLGFMTKEADALSVQARGMVVAIPLEQADSFSANGLGLDVFVYEGGNLDIFLGAEQDSFSATSSNSWPDKKFAFSAKATAFDLGFRFKPTTSWRIKPYFPVELLYFQDISYSDVNLESTKAGQTTTILSYSQPGKIGGRLGVGTDIGLSDSLTLGIEGVVTYFPGIKIKHNDSSVVNGTTYNSIWEDNVNFPFMSINLGLRYSF